MAPIALSNKREMQEIEGATAPTSNPKAIKLGSSAVGVKEKPKQSGVELETGRKRTHLEANTSSASSARQLEDPQPAFKIARTEADKSHVLYQFRGVVFCNRCGHYATVKLLKLAKPCTGRKVRKERRIGRAYGKAESLKG